MPVFANIDDMLEHAGPVHRPEPLQRRQPTRRRARHHHRFEPDLHLSGIFEETAIGCIRAPALIIEADVRVGLGVVDLHPPHSADARQSDLGRAHARSDGHRRVDRVAAFHQRAHTGQRRQRMRRRDHAIASCHRRPQLIPRIGITH